MSVILDQFDPTTTAAEIHRVADRLGGRTTLAEAVLLQPWSGEAYSALLARFTFDCVSTATIAEVILSRGIASATDLVPRLRRPSVFAEICGSGNLYAAIVFMTHWDLRVRDHGDLALKKAAAGGSVAVVEWLAGVGEYTPTEIRTGSPLSPYQHAVAAGQAEVTRWFDRFTAK